MSADRRNVHEPHVRQATKHMLTRSPLEDLDFPPLFCECESRQTSYGTSADDDDLARSDEFGVLAGHGNLWETTSEDRL